MGSCVTGWKHGADHNRLRRLYHSHQWNAAARLVRFWHAVARLSLHRAGRQKTYRDTTLYTSLSLCMMCSGTIIQFGIPPVVIGGNKKFLHSKGVDAIVVNDPDCIALMQRFITEKTVLWAKDIAE